VTVDAGLVVQSTSVFFGGGVSFSPLNNDSNRCGSPLVSQLGLGCPDGVVSVELLLMATPVGADMLGIIKHRVKALPRSSLPMPTVSTPFECQFPC
jgi:hypothetical protein